MKKIESEVKEFLTKKLIRLKAKHFKSKEFSLENIDLLQL